MNVVFLILIFMGAQSSGEFLVMREGGVEYCSVSWNLGFLWEGSRILNLSIIWASALYLPPNI